jgi:hypothetical protein
MLMFRRFEPFKFIETDDAGSELRTQNGWTVDFAIEAQLDSDRKSADPRITQAAGTITITAAGNAGEVIRYTTDGTAPVPGGATVQTYSAPFTGPASGTLLRAASTATGMPLSGITEALLA